MTTFRLLLLALVILVATTSTAGAQDSDPGATGSLVLTYTDSDGTLVTGACFELYASADGAYGVLLESFCNTTGTSARTLPEGAYILREVAPPQLRLPVGGSPESHVYRKASDLAVTVSATSPSSFTIAHELGAAVEVQAKLPDGQAALGSCFTARTLGASGDQADSGAVVAEACTGTGATAKLYVGGGPHVISQTAGPSGFAFAADRRVDTVLDSTSQLELVMRAAAVLRVEQRSAAGLVVKGGCYSIYASPSSGAESFVEHRCDSHDNDGTDGYVVADDLQPGRYRLHEETAPTGYKLNSEDFFVVLDRSDLTVARSHERLPYVLVRTIDAGSGESVAGSCWRVRMPGAGSEGIIAEACDLDDGASDGTTRLVVPAGAWELLHTLAPTGYTRLTAVTPITVADADLELSFALTGPQPPMNTVAPSVTGNPRTGSVLTAITGTWTGVKPIGIALRWERCDAAGEGCTPIGGATQATYTVAGSDLGMRLRLEVTGSNIAGATVARSALTEVVVGDPPTNIEPPAITGPALVGARLEANAGWWAGTPTSISYQWERCDAAGAGCAPITGATSTVYHPVAADHHTRLRVAVTASNADGSTVARTALTDALLAPPWNASPPHITGANEPLLVGRPLTGHPGVWVGAPTITTAPQWLRCNESGESCTDIAGATNWAYTGTLADIGSTLRLQVIGTNVDGEWIARSSATARVLAAPPVNVYPPTVTGSLPLRVDGVLQGRPGNWVGTAPIQQAPQWLRCDEYGHACVEIVGATAWTYTLVRADVRSSLRLRVTASNVAGSAVALSAPTGRLEAAPPLNTAPPYIKGAAFVGLKLTGMAGNWVGPKPITLAAQWLRCEPYGGACDAVAGATGWTYTVTLADRVFTIRLQVTATNSEGSTVARSAYTGVVPGTIPGPVNAVRPALSGDLQPMRLGGWLAGNTGTWTGVTPIGFAPQWFRCDENGELCQAIAGATGWAYELVQADVGYTIRLEVAATNVDGTTRSRSLQTPLLLPNPPVNVSLPTLSGDNHVGGRLVGREGGWVGSRPMEYAPRWLRCDPSGEGCAPIDGATTWEYVPTAADAGASVRLEVTATNADGTRAARSPAVPVL